MPEISAGGEAAINMGIMIISHQTTISARRLCRSEVSLPHLEIRKRSIVAATGKHAIVSDTAKEFS